MDKYKEITLVAGAIHNPDEPRHYMTITDSPQLWRAKIENYTLAESSAALELKEVGSHIYSPVIYFPFDNVKMEYLRKNKKSTFCPLKGSTYYLDFVVDKLSISDVAWVYKNAIPDSARIKNMVAFNAAKVDLMNLNLA